jgi:DNA-binding CsgD family transcriptional regulator
MRRGRPPYPDLLTPREQEVLALIRQDLTNEQIGQRLSISESGARYHVSEILSKLGVESREEAAAWQASKIEDRSGKAFGLGLAHLVKGPVNAVPAGAFVAVPAAFVVLLVGFAVISWRGDDGPEASLPPAAESERALAIEGFLDLSQEATAEARILLPEAELAFVAYATPSRQYTFRFFQSGTQSEVSILGPNEVAPAVQRWESIQEQRPSGSPPPAVLDLALLRNSFEAVAEEATARSTFSASNMGILVFNDGRELTWETTARLNRPGRLIRCQAPDADLSLMRCDPLVLTDDEPRQAPTP